MRAALCRMRREAQAFPAAIFKRGIKMEEEEKNPTEEQMETPPAEEPSTPPAEETEPTENTPQETPASDPVPAVDVLIDAMKADYEKRMDEMRKEYEKGMQERDKMIRELVSGEYLGEDKDEHQVTEVARRIRENRGTFSKYR